MVTDFPCLCQTCVCMGQLIYLQDKIWVVPIGKGIELGRSGGQCYAGTGKITSFPFNVTVLGSASTMEGGIGILSPI